MKLHEMDPDDILQILEERGDAVTKAEMAASEAEASFKALEASMALAYKDAGMSMTEAQNRVRTRPEWAHEFKEVQAAHILAQSAKRDLKRAESACDLYRTEAANRRKV